MEISVKSLWMGASVIITVALITLGVIEYRNAKRLSDSVSERVSELARETGQADILKLDGTELTGSDIYSFIKKYLYNSSEKLTVKVSNGKTTASYSDYRSACKIYESDGSAYVCPTDRYTARVQINGNEVITGIEFSKYGGD